MTTSSRSTLVSAFGRGLGTVFPQRPTPEPQAVRRLLVIKPAALGDVLFATPALSALRHSLPKAKVTLAVGRWSQAAVEGNPDVDEVLDCGNFGTPGRYGWHDVWQFAKTIQTRKFDLAVVLDRSPRVAVAPWLAGVPHRVGIDSSGRGFALTVRVPWDRPRHEADLMLDVVRAMGVECGEPSLRYVPLPEHRSLAHRMWEEWGLTRHFPIVVIHPGGASNPGMTLPSKRWPAVRFAALADRLVEEIGARIVVVGHGADAPLARKMRLAMRHTSVDLVGQTPRIGQLAALLQRSHLYVGNDSAPLHLAVAVGTPACGLFGPTDPAINGPYNPPGIGLVHEDACSQRRPFVPGPIMACQNCRCIELISVDRARDTAAQLLKATAPRQSR